jgi:hypothetical protein
MTTFQEIRRFLETNRDELTSTLEADDTQNFLTALSRLQRDWEKFSEDQIKIDVTLGEMRKYPPVWKELEDAGLVPPDDLPAPSVYQPSRVPLRSPKKLEPKATNAKDSQTYSHSSQDVTDRIALWDKKIVIAKELISGAMGGLIVLVTLGVAIATILSVSNASTYAAAKDVLLYMNGLVGVVLGYYFGRVPSDIRADNAEKEAKTANRDRDHLVATVRSVLERNDVPTRSIGSDGLHLTSAQVEQLCRILDKYSH